MIPVKKNLLKICSQKDETSDNLDYERMFHLSNR